MKSAKFQNVPISQIEQFLSETPAYATIEDLYTYIMNKSQSYNWANLVTDYVKMKRNKNPKWSWVSKRIGESRNQKSILKQLAENLLLEDENVPEQESGDSLDAQIDRYLSDYEASSRTAKQEGRDFRRLMRRLLSEAPEDEEETSSDDEAETETEPAPEPTKPSIDSIDVEEFANNVARLIENYDTLLEIKDTLIKRSLNFVSKNYDQSVVDAFEDSMRNKHGLVDGKSKQDVEDELFVAPRADRAGPGGAGA